MSELLDNEARSQAAGKFSEQHNGDGLCAGTREIARRMLKKAVLVGREM